MHLYLHVPFCRRRCSYCDFAIAVRRRVPSEVYVDTVMAEWDWWRDTPLWSSSPTLSTVYAGGGTPSILDPAALGRLIEHLVAQKPLAPEAEVTLEANPDDVTLPRAQDWRALGVNRISLGAQSFDPAVLHWMHRTHGPGQIDSAVDVLRGAGFDNISLDLIFGLPKSLGRDWADDLRRTLALEPSHVSLYGLTVEAHTPLARWVTRGTVGFVGGDPSGRGVRVQQVPLALQLAHGGPHRSWGYPQRRPTRNRLAAGRLRRFDVHLDDRFQHPGLAVAEVGNARHAG